MVARPFEGRRGPEGGGGLRGPEGAGGGGSERTASRRRAERRGPPEHSRGPGNKELPGLAGWPRTVSCLYSCPSDSAPPLRLPTLPSPPFLHLLAGSPLKTPSCFPPTSEAPSPPPSPLCAVVTARKRYTTRRLDDISACPPGRVCVARSPRSISTSIKYFIPSSVFASLDRSLTGRIIYFLFTDLLIARSGLWAWGRGGGDRGQLR